MLSTIPPRSAATARLDTSSVPLPFIGTLTSATCLSGLTETSTGAFIVPVATALVSSCLTAAANCGVVTSLASTVTTAGISPPGKAACMRS